MKRELAKTRGTHVLLGGLYASARALALHALTMPSAVSHQDSAGLFIVMDNAENAQYMYGDLKTIHNAQCTMGRTKECSFFLLRRNGG